MRGRDGNDNGGFANVEAAETMDNGDVADGIVGKSLGSEAPHLIEGHFLIGFVEKMQGASATAVVANDAIEEDDGSVFAMFEKAGNGRRIDGVVSERDVGGGLRRRLLGGLRLSRAATDRRKQGDLVAVSEQVGSRNVFLVHGDGDRGPRHRVRGKRNGQQIDQVGDRGSRVEFERAANGPKPITENAEGEKGYTHAIFIIGEAPENWTDGTVNRQHGQTDR